MFAKFKCCLRNPCLPVVIYSGINCTRCQLKVGSILLAVDGDNVHWVTIIHLSSSTDMSPYDVYLIIAGFGWPVVYAVQVIVPQVRLTCFGLTELLLIIISAELFLKLPNICIIGPSVTHKLAATTLALACTIAYFGPSSELHGGAGLSLVWKVKYLKAFAKR